MNDRKESKGEKMERENGKQRIISKIYINKEIKKRGETGNKQSQHNHKQTEMKRREKEGQIR